MGEGAKRMLVREDGGERPLYAWVNAEQLVS
jgi:hypothetical protein